VLKDRLVAAIWAIYKRMPDGRKQTILITLADITPRWIDGDTLMPGITPERGRGYTGPVPREPGTIAPRFIREMVLFEVKLAVVRFWDLMRDGETEDLGTLLDRLEYYGAVGWENCRVIGDREQGFWLEAG
jgi:hypothetical protein